MHKIRITNKIVGSAYLFEGIRKSGRRRRVPAYEMIVSLCNTVHKFSVTRDVSSAIFDGAKRHFNTRGECPPSHKGSPYLGELYRSKNIPFGIRLHDQNQPKDILLGVSKTRRKNILIHHGPSRSDGCFTISGGKKMFKRFQKLFESYLESGQIVEVIVEPR